LDVLEIQLKHFGLDTLGDAVRAACEDYKRSWFKESGNIPG
jgi:hypothetical protein